MQHEIHRVTGFERVAPFTLRLHFEDGTTQSIDFRPVLAGEIYGPLADPNFFDAVRLDEEAHTLVWPNGADFDPAILHAWPTAGSELAKLARSWVTVAT
ncbi:MAG TPA: DUF2442 domain-containing protein [Thermoanaerobaculia bacterium]